MTTITLIAETPNAGRRGHRFLVPLGDSLGDAIVSSFVSRGRSLPQTVGANYIAVRHKVMQRSTERPDADETLVLVGVDTTSMGENERANLIERLRAFLLTIDCTVRTIDWSLVLQQQDISCIGRWAG